MRISDWSSDVCSSDLIKRAVDLTPLPGLLDHFRRNGVEAIAVAFLHAYVEPSNEQAVLAEIRRLWPEVSVLASHEVSREWREYERTNTTVLSTYVPPITQRYLDRLEDQPIRRASCWARVGEYR